MGEIRDLLASDSLKMRQAGSAKLREIAEGQLGAIQRRLDRGISSSGQRFTPYAPSTARKKGRFHPVTLFESGDMRGAMFVRRVRLDSYEITFRDRENEKIARFQHGGTRRATARDTRLREGVRRRGTRHIIRNTGRFHVPPRPFIEPTREEVIEADRLFEVGIDSQFPTDLRRRIKISLRVSV